MARIFDILLAFFGLILFSPLVLLFVLLIWFEDRKSPIYVARRVGRNGTLFSMLKLRTMHVEAEKTGVFSTATNDSRITKIGSFLRRYKFDEIPQLWNVFIGDMSFIGPRPNVLSDVEKYTEKEKQLLLVRPGITDFASIVFSDEGEILLHGTDPNHTYDVIIRPWKNRLALFAIEHDSLSLRIFILFLTVQNIINRNSALRNLSNLLRSLEAPEDLVALGRRQSGIPLIPPLGAEK